MNGRRRKIILAVAIVLILGIGRLATLGLLGAEPLREDL